MSMFRSCVLCNTEKPLSEFWKQRDRKDGYSNACMGCARARHKARRDRDPDFNKKYALKRKFGISLAQYQAMFAAQQGNCAICEKSQTEFTRRFAVDHCHETGKIRGLLCGECNIGLGKFKDSPDRLVKASKYLKGL